MLIRFLVDNFLSFNKETEFNMLAGDVRRLPHHTHTFKGIKLVKSAAIYGANGAGKSNLIKALGILTHVLILKKGIETSKNNKFQLADNEKKPMKFEIEFIANNKGYSYGIVINDNAIHEEWLYTLGFAAKDEKIFERTLLKNGKTKITFHTKYTKTEKSKLLLTVLQEDFLHSSNTFLSIAKNRQFKEINDVCKWFDNAIFLVPQLNFGTFLWHNSDALIDFTNDLINSIDVGITKLAIHEKKIDDYYGKENNEEKEQIIEQLLNDQTQEIQIGEYPNDVIAFMENGIPKIKKLLTYHKSEKGVPIQFQLSNESDGTLRFLDFIPIFYCLLNYPLPIFIDEIDQSIHPSLIKAFIKKIQENKDIKGQLIFTTHQANLLDLDFFRQDEIWFAEKNKAGATELYPLSEYDIRPDLDIRKGYLSGRFGAIPFLGNFEDLKWNAHAQKAE